MCFLKMERHGGKRDRSAIFLYRAKFCQKTFLLISFTASSHFSSYKEHTYFSKPLTTFPLSSTSVLSKLKVTRNSWLSFITFQQVLFPLRRKDDKLPLPVNAWRPTRACFWMVETTYVERPYNLLFLPVLLTTSIWRLGNSFPKRMMEISMSPEQDLIKHFVYCPWLTWCTWCSRADISIRFFVIALQFLDINNSIFAQLSLRSTETAFFVSPIAQKCLKNWSYPDVGRFNSSAPRRSSLSAFCMEKYTQEPQAT